MGEPVKGAESEERPMGRGERHTSSLLPWKSFASLRAVNNLSKLFTALR